jgi:single-strand DNA-binding protein
MPNLNRLDINCILAKDPVTRNTSTGKTVTSLNVYVPQKASGFYLNVTAWEELGQRIQECHKKSDELFISGRLSYREYVGKDGLKKSAYELVANEFHPYQDTKAKIEKVRQQIDQIEEEIPF